ncbi:MAG: type II secretion system F family protein [Pirellulales bacterium]|nr:type II secretion system F family protein [Pirellulales bacterium]
MPEFTYIAKKTTGQQVKGSISATGLREAIAALTQQALYPMRVEAAQREQPARGWLAWRTPRVKSEPVAMALSQLADLLASGVPLLEALNILATQTPHPTLSQVLGKVRDDVADGSALDEALAKHPRVFPDLVVSIVRAGSAGAFLEDALEQTSEFLGMQEELKARVKGAMAYPVFLAVMGTLVTVALIVFFVPKFSELFAKLEKEGSLPWATSTLLWLSGALWRYGLILIGLVLGILAAWRRFAASPRGQRVMDAVRLRLLFFGPIVCGFAVARCCRVLGTLLKNGVPLLRALAISSDATGNRIFAEAIRASASNVSSGDTLSEPLASSGLFPPQVMAMVRVAEESNTLDTVLLQIADRIERRNVRKLDMLVRFVEPALLLVMGGLMLFVITALLLPVFEMGSSLE